MQILVKGFMLDVSLSLDWMARFDCLLCAIGVKKVKRN